MDSECRKPMNITFLRRNRWMKWSNYSMWEHKFKNSDKLSNSNLTQSESRQKPSLSFSEAPLRSMLTVSPASDTTSAQRRSCWWLRLRGRRAMTMKTEFICSSSTLSDLAAAFKLNTIKRCPKFKTNWTQPLPKYLRSIRRDKIFHKKIYNTKIG